MGHSDHSNALPCTPEVIGCATAQAVSCRLPRSGHVGFVVENVALGQVFSEYFRVPCQLSFHSLVQTHDHLSSGAATIDQTVADVQSKLSLTLPQGTMKIKKKILIL
jgi:hypothetical protein